ncbi:gamma-adducin-like isoform X3 [Strongylocentrotus purpuratus]|uniref:Class II aldolase/adducin N-terminal domain-containing protein n=1 Tax=Strongylocentrotus purpuratus TaxID=7668 RepID=A0A7M7NTZ7_STRPU|nr:gamma-adducin isoform X3 [Strongylocentrotus purpuratus]XP_030841711.1 gamma-adducin-like isoform X3 [Strongylocentrotus purpuratus]
MADTLPNELEEAPQSPAMNGKSSGKHREIDNLDLDDPEVQKDMQRPAHIKNDIKEMDRNKRVSLILNSEAFREELEAIIDSQLKGIFPTCRADVDICRGFQSGPHPASLLALQQISELVLPQSRFNQSSGRSLGGGSSCVIPVADIRGSDSHNYTKGEKALRCKLASLYRLVDLHGWTHLIYNHISARVSKEQDQFLINPFGLLYHEVTASSLVKLDSVGNIIDHGTTSYGPNLAGFTLHSAIHNARPDVKCILHAHTPVIAAVSAMSCGLLPICQEALILGEVSYYDYKGIIIDDEQKDSIIRALGPKKRVLFLRNHGVVCCGQTIEEAYFLTVNVVAACNTQVQAMTAGIDHLIQVSSEIAEKTREVASQGGGGVQGDDQIKKWRWGELEFEAMMRQLDNMGHRTGYIYHAPLTRSEPKPRSDVAYPAVSTGVTYIYDDDVDASKYESPLKMLNRRKANEKTKWMNTPNSYSKVEVPVEQNGEESPKTKTKWVSEVDKTAGHSTKHQDPQQFAKQSDNPREFKTNAKKVTAEQFTDNKNPGPTSQVLAGIDDGRKVQIVANDAQLSNSQEKLIRETQGQNIQPGQFSVGSKGIVQRDHQNDALVYTVYSPNPFCSMTEKDILEYKREIAEKTGQDVQEIELIFQAPEEEDNKLVDAQGEGKTITTTKISTTVTMAGEGDTATVHKTRVTEKTTINGRDENEDDEREPSPGVDSTGSSPTKDPMSPSKKSKKKFRTPSFLKKKEKKEKKGE